MTDSWLNEERYKLISALHPVNRFATVDEVANMILFLSSEESTFCECLLSCGGWEMSESNLNASSWCAIERCYYAPLPVNFLLSIAPQSRRSRVCGGRRVHCALNELRSEKKVRCVQALRTLTR